MKLDQKPQHRLLAEALLKVIAAAAIVMAAIAVLSPATAQEHDRSPGYHYFDLGKALGANPRALNGSSDPFGNPYDGSSVRCDADCRAIMRELEALLQAQQYADPEVERIRDRWRREREEAGK